MTQVTTNADLAGLLKQVRGLLQQGRAAAAETILRQAEANEPDNGHLLNLLGVALKRQNRLQDALPVQERSAALLPDDAAILNNLGNTYLRLGRHGDALTVLRRAAELDPTMSVIHNNLGIVFHEMGNYEQASRSFEQALTDNPDYVSALIGLGNARLAQDRLSEAETAYRRAIALQPDDPWPHNNLAQVLRRQDRHEDAIAVARNVAERLPDNHRVWNNLANMLRDYGDMDGAAQAYRHAITLKSDFPAAYNNLFQIVKPRAEDPLIAQLRRMGKQTSSFSEEDRVYLHFALASIDHALGDYDRAFDHYQRGNQLNLEQLSTRGPDHDKWFANIADTIGADFIDNLAGQGLRGRRPVFIVGLPRSGTTLSEQIIHSHPFGFGAGELELLKPALNGWADIAHLYLGSPVPGAEHGWTPRQRGRWYMDALAARAPSWAERVVNKMPSHFMVLGLIHALLPDAPIIHCRRHPVAAGFSCYQQFFENAHHWTYRLDSIGHYIRAHDALMAHWRRVLPPGRFLEVRYEALVADPETQIRRMLDYLDLPWNPACLDFHRSKRAVSTASVTQVRQPLYQRAVSGWRAYEHHLGPLMDAIGRELIADYEAGDQTNPKE